MAQLLQDQPFGNGDECMSARLRRTKKHLKRAQQHIEEQVSENLQYGCAPYPRPFPRSPLSCAAANDPPASLLPPFDSVKEQDCALVASMVFVEAPEFIEEAEGEGQEVCGCVLPELPRKTVTFRETPGDYAAQKACSGSCSECNLSLLRRPPPYQRLDNRNTQTHEKGIRVQQVPFERRHADNSPPHEGYEGEAMAKASPCGPLFNMYQAVYILGCLMWTAVFIRLVTM